MEESSYFIRPCVQQASNFMRMRAKEADAIQSLISSTRLVNARSIKLWRLSSDVPLRDTMPARINLAELNLANNVSPAARHLSACSCLLNVDMTRGISWKSHRTLSGPACSTLSTS